MSLDRPTELRRLALVLHREPAALGHLDALDGAALMKLRQRLQTSLLEQFQHLFERLAGSGKLAPDALSALLCRKVFGASITANMSYYVPADRAVRMCSHFEPGFMADIAREQIPERAEAQLRDLPVTLMQGVMRELLQSRDYPTLGGFTDYMPEDKALLLMREIADPADSLRISSYAQAKDRIARLAAAMDDAKLQQLIATARGDTAFLREMALVVAEMPAAQQQRMARLADAVDGGFRPAMRAAVGEVDAAATAGAEAGLAGRMRPYFEA